MELQILSQDAWAGKIARPKLMTPTHWTVQRGQTFISSHIYVYVSITFLKIKIKRERKKGRLREFAAS